MHIRIENIYSKLLWLLAFVLLVGIALPIWTEIFRAQANTTLDRDQQLKGQLRDQHINISTMP